MMLARRAGPESFLFVLVVLALSACVPPRGAEPVRGNAPGAVALPAPELPVPAPAGPPGETLVPALAGSDVIGLGEGDLTRLLGAPRLRRREGPGELWQYAGRDCLVQLYLYREPVAEADAVGDGAPQAPARVTHMDAVGRNAAAMAPADCLATISRPAPSGDRTGG